jgi:DNA-binding transcriptional ArsR family regulator
MQKGQNIGQSVEIRQVQTTTKEGRLEDFVLEKSIFNNIFEKDIRRVFIYKKAERLAKAIHLISPAFAESASLRSRIDTIAMGLIDAAVLPSGSVRTTLSRELLALSSVLSIARTGGLLSPMNTDLITHEAHSLLQEVAGYEEPRILLEDAPTLSSIAKSTTKHEIKESNNNLPVKRAVSDRPVGGKYVSKTKGHVKDTEQIKDRRETILSVIKNKHKASIKDISTLIRGVSEKTVQRELASLIEEGIVLKQGERRWSIYSLA